MKIEDLEKAQEIKDKIETYEKKLEQTQKILNYTIPSNPQQKVSNMNFKIKFDARWKNFGCDWAGSDYRELEINNELELIQLSVEFVQKICNKQIKLYQKKIKELKKEMELL